ncbi:MAG: hypothetical protein Q9217_005564 [Psora testacea]
MPRSMIPRMPTSSIVYTPVIRVSPVTQEAVTPVTQEVVTPVEVNVKHRSLIPRVSTSSIVNTPVKNASLVVEKAARLDKLNVKSQVAPVQSQRQAGTAHRTVVSHTAKSLAAARIAECRQRVANHITKKPTTASNASSKPVQSPISTRSSSPAVAAAASPSIRKYYELVLGYEKEEGRYVPWTLKNYVEFTDDVWQSYSYIPAAPESDWILVDHPTVRETRPKPKVTQRRGSDNYCSGRPSILYDDGTPWQSTIDGVPHHGRTCDCHPSDSDIAADTWGCNPQQWATTPAEEDVQPNRPRKVRFADHLHPGYDSVVTSCIEFKRWYKTTWPSKEDENIDYSWVEDEEEDDVAIEEQPEPAKKSPAKPKDDLDLDAMLNALTFDDDLSADEIC